MDQLKDQPGIGVVIRLVEAWPRLTAWIVLSIGFCALLIYEARDVGLTTGNWIALIVATVLVAGLCVWIVSWEDEEPGTSSADAVDPAAEEQADT